MPACGRTGAGGWIDRVVPRSSGHRHATQPVSTKARGGVHRRMLTRRGAPQVGQRAARGGGGGRGGGGPSLGRVCPSIRRIVASGRAPLAWSKLQWRTFIK